MNTVVGQVMQKISDGRPSDSGTMQSNGISRLANLLAALRRHQRQMQHDASTLRSPSTSQTEAVDITSVEQ